MPALCIFAAVLLMLAAYPFETSRPSRYCSATATIDSTTEPLYTALFLGSIPMTLDNATFDAGMIDTHGVADGSEALRSGRRGRTFESCRPDFEGLPAAIETLAAGETLLVEGLPNRLYHGLPCPSKSPLWDFRRHGPVWYYQRYIAHTQSPFSSGALQLGSVIHAALELGPGKYRSHLSLIPADYVTASGGLSSGKEAKAWLADQDPDLPLASPADVATTEAILEQFFSNAAARDLYERIDQHELSAIHHRDDGHILRCRFDAKTWDGVLLDWKSCRDVRPLETWHKSVLEHGYHYQSALYSQIASAAGLSDQRLTFVAMSTTPPHQVQVVTLPERLVLRCEQWIADDLEELAARTESGNWLPASYGEVTELYIPEWAMRGDA